ncbi:LysR family transcriptional regulator [Fuerstiella marisgermanici]|uniref:HTH-type transcriptional activator CmpR n=1 Tax=Fuerstiella marisgermanici TaxID=1891926 RepID=A0A1P8WQU4_9PLAN|nr:LysR family transcriptional regulator [Fuerstiella marisgermanici]APZ96435.1 HTH-type transcriptional activator CmpR [Fuerstiella marisgermanici]
MNHLDAQLPHLETFSVAAELCSFTGAGKTLKLTQAAVSQRIRALECSIGKPLFHRQGGRVSLTDAGIQLYGYAQQILNLHREARQAVAGEEVPLHGNLSLAASSIPGQHLLPAGLCVFRNRFPDVAVRASIEDSMAVLDRVESGQAHLGLVGQQTERGHFHFRPFVSDELLLIVNADDRWKKRQRIRLPDLLRRPIVLRESGSGSRWCLQQALLRKGHTLDDLNVTLELGSNEAVKEAVLNNTGIAVLSRLAVQRELDDGRLISLKIQDVDLVRDLFVVSDTRHALPRSAQTFLQFWLASHCTASA